MATKPEIRLVLLLSILLFSSTLILALSSEREEARDPQRQLEQCRRKCEQHEGQQERRCEQQCRWQYEEQQRRRQRQGEDSLDGVNYKDAREEQDVERCKQECHQQPHYDQGMRRQCEERCEQQGRRQQEQQEGQWDPKRALEQCEQQCAQSYQGRKERQCRQQCQERYQEEQKQQRRGQENYETNELGSSGQGSSRGRLEECQRQCRESHRGQHQQHERRQCEQYCQERHQEEQQERWERREQGQNSYANYESVTSGRERLEECQRQCRHSYQGQGQQEKLCVRRCQQRYREDQSHKQQEWGVGDVGQTSRREWLEQCQRQCRQSYQGQHKRERKCERQCQRRYQEEQWGHQQGRGGGDINNHHWQSNNPYVLKQESIRQHYRHEHGNIQILENFLRKSRLHLGIANYRLEFLEANPQTFVVPGHFDADKIIFVLRGEGTITLIREDQERESHNISQGDTFKVPAGAVIYLINRSNNQNLQIVKLLNPVYIPGEFQTFRITGDGQPESYYRAFSNEVLEAALNTRREELDKLFGQQRRGIFVRASQEQIRALSRHSSSSSKNGHKSKGESETTRVINLFNQRPAFSNNHGQLYESEVDKELNIRVDYINITQGSMVAPFFNSRATKIVVVRSGSAHFEMVCPHLSRQEQEQHERGRRQYEEEEYYGEEEEEEEEEEGSGSSRYQLVRSEVSRNNIIVVPPGHPNTLVATGGENFEAVCFEINARNNRRAFLAGKNNIVSKMEREAQELAFGLPSKVVEQVFGEKRQRDQVFVRGPQQQQQRGWESEGNRHALQSILEFVGY